MASVGEGNLIGGDWAKLLPELLTLISKRVYSYEDFMAFGGVCNSWRSVAVKENFNHSASSRVQIPWLMLAEEESSRESRAFASLTKRGLIHRVELPESRGRHCVSSMGWLITTDKHGNTELLHPLSRFPIPLPHPTACEYYEDEDEEDMDPEKFLVKRAALSASPSLTDDYVLMAIHGGDYYDFDSYAAFWKPGNNAWTPVEPECLDVIYYKHQFYAIKSGGELLLCNPDSGASEAVGHVPSHITDPEDPTAYYLVESPGGDLLVVRRGRYFHGEEEYKVEWYYTCYFTVYKFDSQDLSKPPQEIDHLQGASIFVGHSAATAVPAAAAGSKPNCIYFTDDYRHVFSSYDYPDVFKTPRNLMGIYNLASQDIEPLPNIREPLDDCSPPIWVLPSF